MSTHCAFAYSGYTKLANVLWTTELQRQFDREGISILALSLHPGSIMTGA